MLADARVLGGRDSITLNNNNNSRTDHPQWSSSYNKVQQGFFRGEMGLANSKHKMTCDGNRGLGFAAKEHIVKSRESTGGGGGGGSNNNLSKHRPRRQTKTPLAPSEGHARPDVAGNSCAPKAPSPARWNRSVGRQQKKHCLFVKGRLRECRFVENCHGQTPDTHPSSRKCSPAPATTRFKGQANCGSPVNGQGQERDCVREPFQGEPYGADMPDTGKQDLPAHHYLKATLNSDADCEADKSWRDRVTPKVTKLESLNQSTNNSCNSLILSAEVPGGEPSSAKRRQQQQQQQQHQQNCSQMGESTTNSERLPSSAALGPKLEREPETEPEPEPESQPRLVWTNRKRRAVRDQIRRVVAELEGILHGLKEVHLEMKEVVQQIELLTSDIDPTGDRPQTGLHSDTLGSSSSSGVTVVGRGKERGENGRDVDLGRGKSDPSPQRTDPSETSSPVLSKNVANDETQQTGNCTEDHVNNLPTKTQAVTAHSDSDCPPANQSSDPTTAEKRKERLKQATLKAGILGHRAKKPPPYPHHSLKTDKGRDCPKAPPYPVKRRLLSTTV